MKTVTIHTFIQISEGNEEPKIAQCNLEFEAEGEHLKALEALTDKEVGMMIGSTFQFIEDTHAEYLENMKRVNEQP